MRWTLRIAAILAVLLLAYAIWPVVGFFRIASAIEARDAPALAKLVDFRALRKNLTKQVVAAYLELTGKEKKLGLLGKTLRPRHRHVLRRADHRAAAQRTDPHRPLSKGEGGAGIKVPAEFAPFSANAMKSGWQTWWASEYGLGDYYVYLPPDKPLDKRFKVKLSLTDFQWKLAGIDLPEPMRLELAQELMKRREAAKE